LGSRKVSKIPLRNKTETYHPNDQEEVPELILKCNWVFEPKNEDISKHNNQIDNDQKLLSQSIFDDLVIKADKFWKRSIGITKQVWKMNQK
jgi:hypothetical protein